jgi:hypothetical protein
MQEQLAEALDTILPGDRWVNRAKAEKAIPLGEDIRF